MLHSSRTFLHIVVLCSGDWWPANTADAAPRVVLVGTPHDIAPHTSIENLGADGLGNLRSHFIQVYGKLGA